MFIFKQRIAVNCTELSTIKKMENTELGLGWKGLYEEKNHHRGLPNKFAYFSHIR
jgi:hypothetical protein